MYDPHEIIAQFAPKYPILGIIWAKIARFGAKMAIFGHKFVYTPHEIIVINL